MTDCPLCHSRRCVDDTGYCCACSKSVRTALSGLTGRVRTSLDVVGGAGLKASTEVLRRE